MVISRVHKIIVPLFDPELACMAKITERSSKILQVFAIIATIVVIGANKGLEIDRVIGIFDRAKVIASQVANVCS